jgi:hypothetical protein
MEQVKAAVLAFVEAGWPVVAPMDYVDRHSRKHDARAPRHALLNAPDGGAVDA